MLNVLDDITLPRDKFVHVKNTGNKDLDLVFNSRHFKIKAGETQLCNYWLYTHFMKAFEALTEKPLLLLEENEGNLEYAKSRANHLQNVAQEKIVAAQKAAAEAEEAKKKLAEARVLQKSLDKLPDKGKAE